MGKRLDHTVLFERGDFVYLVAPVAPLTPSDKELDELAFGDDLRKMAPNEHIGWMRGQYVEADRPNANGQEWSAEELSIKSLTPMLMPVTIMHDPRTAVGLIADAKLLTPEAAGVPRSRIDTTLGVWKHRFPEVWEEAAQNYAAGSLMQSMECRPAYYDCVECGKRFPKLPGGAEKVNWCAHLRGETAAANGRPARRLGNVTFTGTGLIFGTRGASGALDTAHLEVLQEEVAEFHERAKSDRSSKRRHRRMDTFEIQRSEYDELKAKAAKSDELASRVADLEEKVGGIPDLEKKVEDAEAAQKKAEDEKADLQKKVDEADEKARTADLSKDRLSKLGKGFTTKLGDFTRGRLEEQAGKLTDDEWDARLKELEETAGVKRDEGGAPSEEENEETVSREETARSQVGGGGGGNGTGTEPSAEARRSVVAGLLPGAKK
jgi:hypothetical protein